MSQPQIVNAHIAECLAHVQELHVNGASLDDAIHTVQQAEHTWALAEDLDWGPTVNVRRAWELHMGGAAMLDQRALIDAPAQLTECAKVIDALVALALPALQLRERIHAEITAGIARNTARAARRALVDLAV